MTPRVGTPWSYPRPTRSEPYSPLAELVADIGRPLFESIVHARHLANNAEDSFWSNSQMMASDSSPTTMLSTTRTTIDGAINETTTPMTLSAANTMATTRAQRAPLPRFTRSEERRVG